MNKINGIIIGIRFNRSFRIPDIAGEIIDHILNHSKSPFNEKMFPRVQIDQNQDRILYNDKTDEYLKLNTDDLILYTKVDKNFDEKFEWIRGCVMKYFQDNLFTEFKIKNVRRFGVVFLHEVHPVSKILNPSIQILTKQSIDSPDEVAISFSKKLTSEEALIKKRVSDYKNRIYTLKESQGVLNANLDCQYYYDPVIEDLREAFTDNILEDAKKYLTGNFHGWLNEYETKRQLGEV